MPASYVHQCIALDACRERALYAHAPLSDAVRAGAEGPDPLFFALMSPGALSAPRAAAMIHAQRTDEFLLALMGACRSDALLEAYCCGFLSHYAADTICHPFIYAHSLTQEGAYSSTEHSMLEHGLETLYYRRRGHAAGLPVQMAGFAALSSAEKDAIAHALAQAFRRTFPDHALSESLVRRSFDQGVSLTRLLRSSSGKRYAALGALLHPVRLDRALHAHMLPLNPPDADIANEARAPWRSPWAPDERRTESFFDLCGAAVSRSSSLIDAAQRYFSGAASYASLRALLGGLSYASGLPWSGSCPVAKAPGLRRGRQP